MFRELVFRRLPVAVLAAAAVAGAVGGAAWSERVGPLPWLVSLAVIGLPHGAADFAVSRRDCRGWRLAAVWCLYLAAMAVVATAFVLAPLAVIVIFLAVSCWHFGAAHVGADGSRDGFGQRIVASLGRGCAALAAPLVVWPAATADVAADLAGVAGLATGRAERGTSFSPEAIVVVGFGLAAVAVTAVSVEGLRAVARPERRAVWGRLVGELVVITSLGVFTDPLFAVGLYFLVWHAWRQMENLDETLAVSPARSGPELFRHLVHIHAAALPLLLPTWIVLGAVWWLWAPEPAARGLAIVSIAAYLVVTPAHELLGDFLHANVAASVVRRHDARPRGRRAVRRELRETSPSGGTFRSGPGRARPAAWG
jgi:Brp/Blh family beta-carotene 15,15'-monooxygenase